MASPQIVCSWKCMQCDEGSTDVRADKLAEKHTKDTKHGTMTSARPA